VALGILRNVVSLKHAIYAFFGFHDADERAWLGVNPDVLFSSRRVKNHQIDEPRFLYNKCLGEEIFEPSILVYIYFENSLHNQIKKSHIFFGFSALFDPLAGSPDSFNIPWKANISVNSCTRRKPTYAVMTLLVYS
jgi:hypothetical protein